MADPRFREVRDLLPFNQYNARLSAAAQQSSSAMSEMYRQQNNFAAQQQAAAAAPNEYNGEYYDPNNATADWAGFVPKPSGRQHNFAHGKTAHSQSLVADGTFNAMVPSEKAPTSDWHKPGKKMQLNHGAYEPARVNNDGSTYRSSSFDLFGGPDPIQRVSGAQHFATEARSNFIHPSAAMQGLGGGTGIDQLTSKARSLYVAGKKPVEPAFLMPNGGLPAGMTQQQYLAAMRLENPYSANGDHRPTSSDSSADGGDPDSLIGFRHNPRMLGGSMMTAGLGSSLLAAGIAPPMKPEQRLAGGVGRGAVARSAPFAVDCGGETKTDPYDDGKGGRTKDLFKENFSGGNAIPGYTGKRR